MNRVLLTPVRDIHDSARWVAHVAQYIPPFTRVYSGAQEILNLFAAAGYETKLIEKRLPITGTEVRGRMKAGLNWQELVPTNIVPLLEKLKQTKK